MSQIRNIAHEQDLREALDESIAQFARNNPRSQQEDQRAARSMPGGNTRSVLFYPPFPLTMARGEGQYVWDIDNHKYTNFVGEFGAGLFGHSNTRIRDAIVQALGDGTVLGGPNRYERVLAAEIVRRFPSVDKVRFTNSGTEANLMAISTARAFTGRNKVMVFDGAYHGGVFLFDHGPSRINAPFDYIIAPFNDTDQTVSLISEHADDLACVVIEPLQGSSGMIPGDKSFLETLRSVTAQHGVVLIFDEVVTSRLSGGGLQQILGVTPDMTALGKYIGGGATFGAFGGRDDIMQLYDPRSDGALAHAGTFNNNVITHAAGSVAMTEVYTPEVAEEFNARGDRFRARLNETVSRHDLPMIVTGMGSIMQIHCCEGPIRNSHDSERENADKAALIFYDLLAEGQRMTWRNSLLLGLPVTDDDLDGFVEAFDKVLARRGHLLAIT